jgi:hypothetical protein
MNCEVREDSERETDLVRPSIAMLLHRATAGLHVTGSSLPATSNYKYEVY